MNKENINYECRSSADKNRFSHEKRDCTVRAISCAFNIPYEKAHAFMKKNGRADKHGVIFRSVIGYKPRVIFGKRISLHKNTKGTVGKFIKNHPTGTYIIAIRHHVFAVKDGVIFDLLKPNPNWHIKDYYYISTPKISSNEIKDNNNKPESLGNTQTLLQSNRGEQTECEQPDTKRES